MMSIKIFESDSIVALALTVNSFIQVGRDSMHLHYNTLIK